MTFKTILLSKKDAEFLKENCETYGCAVVECVPADPNPKFLQNSVKITVAGEDESVKNLFEKYETVLAKQINRL